jgi:putative ABC transport system permease protein
MGFGAVDRPDATGTDIPWAGWRLVSSDYFKALGVPLLAGRDFTERDQLGAQPYPVIISQRIAELLWPGESAIGRPLELWKGQTSSRGEVIGVAGDMRDWALTEDPTYSVYLPIHGYGRSLVYAVVHGGGPTAALVSGIRSAVAGVNPALPVGGVQRLDEIVADSVASRGSRCCCWPRSPGWPCCWRWAGPMASSPTPSRSGGPRSASASR